MAYGLQINDASGNTRLDMTSSPFVIDYIYVCTLPAGTINVSGISPTTHSAVTLGLVAGGVVTIGEGYFTYSRFSAWAFTPNILIIRTVY